MSIENFKKEFINYGVENGHIKKPKRPKTELITKKELLNIIINDPDLNIDNFKNMKVSELRQILKITHKITSDNEIHYVNNYGFCFSCFKILKPDYTKYENYCLDCL
jgi:hypothetical protein